MASEAREELKVRAYRFSVEVIKFTRALPSNKLDLILITQLIRSATSIGANIIEAQAASSKKDFAKFFIIALKSANETVYWLNLINDTMVTDEQKINILTREVSELAKILGASVITLRKELA
jgi:four helix bundle protein